MSLLLAPFVLLALGLLGARLAKTKRLWHHHSRFPRRWLTGVVGLAYAWDMGMLLDLPYVAWAAWLPGRSSLDWFLNLGLLGMEATWPLASRAVVAVVVLAFAAYPLWAWLGYAAGVILFGRSPKQTGVLGLMR